VARELTGELQASRGVCKRRLGRLGEGTRGDWEMILGRLGEDPPRSAVSRTLRAAVINPQHLWQMAAPLTSVTRHDEG